jgi:twitching motility protein PilJ
MNKPQSFSVDPIEPTIPHRQTDEQASAIHRLRKFVQNHLVGTITVTISTSLVLGGLSTWNIWRIYSGFRATVTEQFALEKMSGKIVHLDEVLTMSAKMAASTGDVQWEKRYNQYVPELDQAIKTILAKVPASIQAEAAKTDNANQKLVDMETKAFALVKQGKPQAAAQILNGADYVEQKQIYSQGNSRVLVQIEQFIQQQLQNYQEQLKISIATAAVILPLVLAGWLLVLLAVRDYIRDRIVAQAKLESSRADLLALTETLRQEATLRQEKENLIRTESEQLQEDIAHILDVVCSLEEGDLTVQAEVNERATGLVGDTLNRLGESLGTLLTQVSTSAHRVADGSQKQQAIAAIVAQGTNEQVHSVSQALRLTETVRMSAQQTAQQLADTSQSLLDLQQTVQSGRGAVTRLSEEIDVLQEGSDRMVQQMKTLGEFVGLTDQFVHEQSEIAVQTQVLALNASLVAARAAQQRDPQQFGQVAREFESIAEQVGQLAQQTNEGLTSLEQRSSQIYRVVSDVDTDIQRLGTVVDRFTLGVKQTLEVFENVEGVTGQAVDAGEAVTKTSEEIVAASDSTATTIQAIAGLSTDIAQQSVEARSLSDGMDTLSDELLQSIAVFKLPSVG